MPESITLGGLDGANPLGMLAALGAFRIATQHDDQATLHWTQRPDGWRPVVASRRTRNEFIADIVAELHRLAGPKARALRREGLKSQIAKAEKQKAKLETEASKTGKKAPTPERRAQLDDELSVLEAELAAPTATLEALSRPGIPPGVELIDGHDLVAVARAEFRRCAEPPLREPHPPGRPSDADFYAALGCDAILKEKKSELAVEPTPFSFSNGGSGKCLLKDFRNCAAHSSAGALRAILEGRIPRTDDVTSLLWDPADQQSYALRWSDPGNPKNAAKFNATANALAFVGLTLQTAVPVAGRPAAVGMDRRCRQWTWPLWESPLDYRTVQALCAHRALQQTPIDPRQTRALGICRVQSSRRFFLNKRPFFSPSRAL